MFVCNDITAQSSANVRRNAIWKLATNGYFPLMVRISEEGFNDMETSKCSRFTVGRCLVTVYSTGMLSKLFVLPYQDHKSLKIHNLKKMTYIPQVDSQSIAVAFN